MLAIEGDFPKKRSRALAEAKRMPHRETKELSIINGIFAVSPFAVSGKSYKQRCAGAAFVLEENKIASGGDHEN
jgi:hypothetical protein